jgi:hypothetical protein
MEIAKLSSFYTATYIQPMDCLISDSRLSPDTAAGSNGSGYQVMQRLLSRMFIIFARVSTSHTFSGFPQMTPWKRSGA